MNKIIILSEKADATTTAIMMWLIHFGATVVRVNRDDPKFCILAIMPDSVKIATSFGLYTINCGDFVWARRAGLYSVFVSNETNEENLQKKIFQFNEQRELCTSFYWWLLNHCNCCENPFSSIVNKINVLEKAQQFGILVPDWLVTSEKKELVPFLKRHKKVAVKSFNTLLYQANECSVKFLTNCISLEQINQIPDYFDSFIVQKYIEKKYELRCFLFDKQFYTMAIFSQKDAKTSVDFRNYNKESPNRVVPFQIDKGYSKKLSLLARQLNLFSGSFDILVDACNNYYFLEVNPVGQFGMVSYPCNYFIEKNIALFIINQLNGHQ